MSDDVRCSPSGWDLQRVEVRWSIASPPRAFWLPVLDYPPLFKIGDPVSPGCPRMVLCNGEVLGWDDHLGAWEVVCGVEDGR